MKMHQIYECEKCGKTSNEQDEIELCEAVHMGLTTLEEKHTYDALCSSMRYAISQQSTTNNEMTRKYADDSVEKVIAFEKEHNMIV